MERPWGQIWRILKWKSQCVFWFTWGVTLFQCFHSHSLPPFLLNSKASPSLLVRSLSAVKKPRSWSRKSRSLNIISIFPRTKSRTRELLPWIHPMPKYCSSSSSFSSFRSSTSSSSTTTIRPSCQPHQSMGPKWQLSLRKHLLPHYCYQRDCVLVVRCGDWV